MQLKRKGKGLLYLIAIAVLISIVFVACKNKPTGMNDFETDIIDISDETINKDPGTSTPNDGDSTTTQKLTQDDIDKLGTKIFARDFLGYYFESADSTFKAQVIKIQNHDAIKLKGTDENNNPVNRIYYMSSAQDYKTTTYRTFLCGLSGNESVKTEATFRNGGTLELKLQNSSGTSYTLKLALKKKAKTDTTDLIK